jgi:hypothetical protein
MLGQSVPGVVARAAEKVSGTVIDNDVLGELPLVG